MNAGGAAIVAMRRSAPCHGRFRSAIGLKVEGAHGNCCTAGLAIEIQRRRGDFPASGRVRIHRFVETGAAVGAMRNPCPPVRGSRSDGAERTPASRAWRSIQGHDDCDQSGEQDGKRKPIQPEAGGCKDRRQNAKHDPWKHEQRHPVSAPLQIIPDRHGPRSYLLGGPAQVASFASARLNCVPVTLKNVLTAPGEE